MDGDTLSAVKQKPTLHTMNVELSDLPVRAQHHGIDAAKDIVFGSIAGMVGKCIEYPFDTVKVRLQSQPDGLPLRYSGPIDCFRQSISQEGIQGLYRGISAPLLGAAIENSSLFFSYRLTQRLARDYVYGGLEKLPYTALLVCGAASGAFTSLLLTPVELVKCKMQVPSGPQGKTLRPLAIVSAVFRTHGILGLWRGQLGTLIRETGGSASWFGGYEGVSALFRHYNPPPQEKLGTTDDQVNLPIYQQMIAGATAGVLYNFIFYPADTIKSRIQTEDITAHSAKNGAKMPSFWSVGRTVWKQYGVAGLYRGCGITVARSAPSSAFIFAIYEALKDYFQ
ncbi:mitochondrial ornithine carrier protein [Microsporum audouinii]